MMWVLHSQGMFYTAPVALGRPRMSKFGAYMPKKSFEYQKQCLKDMTVEHKPLSCAIKLSVTFVHARPKRLTGSKYTVQRIPKTTKPDLDNLLKMVMDILTKAKLWEDDNLVVSIDAQDWYCANEEEPHTQWRVYQLCNSGNLVHSEL